MSDENSTPEEDQSKEQPQQQLIPAAIEEVQGATNPLQEQLD